MFQHDVRLFMALAPQELEKARRLLRTAVEEQAAGLPSGIVRPEAYKLLRLLTSHLPGPAGVPVVVTDSGPGEDCCG